MTLSLPADPLEILLKVKVSRHVACTWTWGMKAQVEEDAEPRYFLTLKKCHPMWEIFTEVVQHLPGWLPSWLQDRDWYDQLYDKHCAVVGEIEITEHTAASLYPMMVQLAHMDDDNDDE